MTTAEQPPPVRIDWTRGKWSSMKGKYSREHTWLLDGGVKLRVSDCSLMLPEGYRDNVQVDPQKTFIATIASAHMLSWLHIAFGYGIEVHSYSDTSVGVMSEHSAGAYWISEVILHPQITYHERSRATASAEARLHELAHAQCFIAQSIKTKVTVRAG